MRSQRVVHLDAGGVEVPVLGEDIVCRVGREDEGRRVRPPGRIEQAAVPEERAREQLGRAAAPRGALREPVAPAEIDEAVHVLRSEEHTSELQSLAYLVCRLLLEKKKDKIDRGV